MDSIIVNNDSGYELKLDLTIGKDHLFEWQIGQMDDEHFTELIARITEPNHTFKTIVWVHGGQSDNLIGKLIRYTNGSNSKIQSPTIEKIVVIHKENLYTHQGHRDAIIIYNKNKE